MSKRARPTLIGAFVVGAVVVAVVAVGVLGSGKFFRKVYPAVLYFKGDVNGLRIGAPVKFKGIQVGEVKNVLLRLGDNSAAGVEQGVFLIPVIIDLDEANITGRGGRVTPDRKEIARLVEAGLRGQLKMESFVTGLLYVDLDLVPKSPAEFHASPDVPYPEIPTLPTALEQVQAKAAAFLSKLDTLDVDGLVDSLRQTVASIDRVASSPGLQKTLDQLPASLGKVDEAVDQLHRTLDGVEDVAHGLKAETIPRADEAIVALREALRNAQALLEPGSPLMYEVGQALDQLSLAAAAINRVASELERNPSMLLRGRAIGKDDR